MCSFHTNKPFDSIPTNKGESLMLTDAQLRRIKANPNKKTPDKYSDTNGLQLHVFPTGRKTWIYAYRYQNKQRSLTLGSYPDLSLADARIKLSEAKKP
jgi:hypothetical protein